MRGVAIIRGKGFATRFYNLKPGESQGEFIRRVASWAADQSSRLNTITIEYVFEV